MRHEKNLGFVHSVNDGMALHADRDVVLLNSDTEVPEGWLSRMREAAYSQPRIATVTPFSNNATICSYPFWGWEGGLPGSLGLAGLDERVAKANAGVRLEIPTAVGFCMYIRRDALLELGLFDAQRYGRGYGEENDFCMRAWKAGWKNVLAADVFVFHEGSVSFSEERFALMEAAAQVLLDVHPEYSAEVHKFLDKDNVEPMRAAIDRERAQHGHDEARLVIAERIAEHKHMFDMLQSANYRAHTAEQRTALLETQLASSQAESAARKQLLDELRGAGETELDRLRAGLAHAESLAFSRQRELESIHAFWGWRVFSFLARKRRGSA